MRFAVKQNFRVTAEMKPRFLAAGAFYAADDEVDGLIPAEANELVRLAPEGTFQALDEQAESITAKFNVNVGGTMGAAGKTGVG